MKNIHIILTDKPSRLQLNVNTKNLILFNNIQSNNESVHLTNQNIYITSDEEIKVGDWVIEFQKGDNIGEVHFINGEYVIANDIQKKIIITTDQDLERVQAIDNDFLEWFVKNQSCEEVEIESWETKDKWGLDYKIIIPKEKPKQETHICKYCKAETTQSDDECYAKPKQDSLEKAAKQYAEMHQDVSGNLGKYLVKAVFQDGGKWQAERMYSEQDMAESFVACWKANVSEGMECKLSFKEWFEQFKKK